VKNIFYLFLILFFNAAYAATFPSYYCANTFQTVKLGDSPDTVRTACGQPSTNITHQVPVVTPTTITQWTYTLGLLSFKGTAFFLPTILITFDNNQQVTQISRNNSFVITSYCALNGTINVGDPASKVLATCGQPSFVNTQQQAVTTSKNVSEWTYNFGPYKPQIIFDFENNQLAQITSGQLGK
jgi:hypothetical protein